MDGETLELQGQKESQEDLVMTEFQVPTDLKDRKEKWVTHPWVREESQGYRGRRAAQEHQEFLE